MKVALVYDRVNKFGGAERVLLALHKLFPYAPLFTSVYNPKVAKWAKEFEVKTSFLQSFPYATSMHELYPLLMPIAFEQFNFDEFDLVISVTSESAKGIVTRPQTKHLSYCLTPTRYLWSGYENYFANPLFRFISRPAVAHLRSWDKIAASRPDAIISISTEVKKRIKKYYALEANIIYPPHMLKSTSSDDIGQKGDYFLVVSRLVGYKRVELAIKACNELKVPLKIIGTGVEEEKLKRMAGRTVEFLGTLTDEKLVTYYKNCIALLFPGIEDFGLTMVEAQSFGKPVIAFSQGGAEDIVKNGVTGILFDSQTVESLKEAILDLQSKSWDSGIIQKSTEKFSFANFEKAFMGEVRRILA